MITDKSTLLDLLRGGKQGNLRLCRQADGSWMLIGNDGHQPSPHVVADSVVSPEIAAWAIEQKLAINLFEGRRKYESDIYHLAESVPAETTAYIEQRWFKE